MNDKTSKGSVGLGEASDLSGLTPQGNTCAAGIGAVAAGDAHTATAGEELLCTGGNAVDAAVGATLAACVAEPVLTAPFGGGFAVVGQPGGEPPTAYNFFANVPGLGLVDSPQETPGFDFAAKEVSFGPTTQVFHVGRGAAATPLMLPGLLTLHRNHGQLPLSEVVAPAVRLAERGVPLSRQVAPILSILEPILRLTPESTALFAPEGHILKAGERFVSPDLAAFLTQVGAGDVESARHGLLSSFGAPSGRLTAADLAHRRIRKHHPVRVTVGPYEVCLTPPPSVGGLLVGFGLRLLESAAPSVWQDESETMGHLLAAMAVTQEAREAVVDVAALEGPNALVALKDSFLSDEGMGRWRPRFQQVLQQGPLAPTAGPKRDLGSTTHISVIDGNGMACGITTSNGEGCGHVVPGAGVMANNFMGEEDINPGGFHVRPAGEHLTSMMCPTVVLRDGAPVLVLGTGGSNRIRTALLQTLVHHLLAGKSVEAAVTAPRIHYEGGPLFIERQVLEHKMPQSALELLASKVPECIYFDAPNMFFGGVHSAGVGGGGAGDLRRGGTLCRA